FELDRPAGGIGRDCPDSLGEVRQRGRVAQVVLWHDLDPRAASTDISKIVRMEYGSDRQYFEMAAEAIRGWRQWNTLLGEKVFHEVGFLLLMQNAISHPSQIFEKNNRDLLQEKGFPYEEFDAPQIKSLFPAINSEFFSHALFSKMAGYVESAKAIEVLAKFAKKLGVQFFTGQTGEELLVEQDKVVGIRTLEGETFYAEHTLIAAGAHSSLLVPGLKNVLKPTGHPVFHLVPRDKHIFESPHLPVFSADISNTGWYGFPYHPKAAVVKIARHTNGIPLHPIADDRRVGDKLVRDMRDFVANAFPALNQSPLVYTRICLYTDTPDGHFWIDRFPTVDGLSIASGGSGHAMKMGPVLGPIIADMIEEKANPWLDRFRRRTFEEGVSQQEEARFFEEIS
ncbi:MAG: FAD-dependent oxidoreductase, partial [Bacteroidota bacterium]